jgi:DnaJ-class molecular chaperone
MAHPDRAGAASDQFFIKLKQAEDTLVDPVKRFAYERFGPDILHWKACATEGDYITTGFQKMIGRYIGTVIVMAGAQMFGRFPHGTYVCYTKPLSFPSRNLLIGYTVAISNNNIPPRLRNALNNPPFLSHPPNPRN